MAQQPSSRSAFVISGPAPSPRLVADLKRLGCQRPVHIPEVDMRSASAAGLLEARLISPSGYASITTGRSAHYELPSTAAVGCFLSHMEAMRQVIAAGSSSATMSLVLEEDCVLDVSAVQALLERLEASSSAPPSVIGEHVILVGGRALQGCKEPGCLEESARLSTAARLPSGSDFVLKPVLPGSIVVQAHCCLYSPLGAKRMLSLLESMGPISVQVDYAMCAASALSQSRGAAAPLLWWSEYGARQRRHASSIQVDCFVCHLSGAAPVIGAVSLLLVVFVVGVCVGVWRRRGGGVCGPRELPRG